MLHDNMFIKIHQYTKFGSNNFAHIYLFRTVIVWGDSTVNTVIWHVVNARLGHCVTTSLENARNDVSLIGRDQNVIVS